MRLPHLALDAAVAVGTAASGLAVSLGTGLWAAATGNGTDVTSWAQVGGTVTAVSALAYVAKLLADGKLVAVPIEKLIADQAIANAHLAELTRDGHEREVKLWELVRAP